MGTQQTSEVESVARRWFEEVWNQRRCSTIDELAEPDAFAHLISGSGRGLDEFKKARAQLLAGLPDMKVILDEVVVHGENEIVRWRVTGTHGGELAGIAASGRPVQFEGMTWLKIRNGRIYEGWDRWNFGGFVSGLMAADSAGPTAAGA